MDQPMATSTDVKGETFTDCRLEILRGEHSLESHDGGECVIDVYKDIAQKCCTVRIRNGSESSPCFKVNEHLDHSKVGARRYLVDLPEAGCSLLIEFPHEEDMLKFKNLISDEVARLNTKSIFDERTDKASATQYFQFYGYLSQQQNMMQDYIRTSTYQRAMLQNHQDFKDKVVLDVGAGSGILSFFAVQAGAKKVYAIEASSMARHAEKLVSYNNLSNKIIVVAGKVEEVDIPEQIDVIISEPMGYMLFNERMLESYLHAKKWLKPGGKMFPTQADLHIAPFFDDALYMEHFSKSNFWYQNSFYGVDLSNLRQAAVDEYFKQPIVDTFDVRILMAKPNTHTTNFLTATEEDLQRIEVPLKYTVFTGGTVHGLAFWFDVVFQGSCVPVWLSTAPQEPLTHWYQVRCLLQTPIFVKAGQTLSGKVLLKSNERQSYDVDIELAVDGTGIKSQNTLDLKNPFFRYTGTQPAIPAGSNTVSPTDLYWAGTGVNMVDGDMGYSGGNGNTVIVGNAGTASVLGNNYPAYNSAAATNGVLAGSSSYAGINSGMTTIPTFGNTHCTNSRFFNGGQSAVLGYSGGYTEYASSNSVTTQGRQYSVIYSR